MLDYLKPSMPDGKIHPQTNLQLLNTGLFKYVWPFDPPGTKGLRELNICETKIAK